ncbi:hypothetical protein OBBRIDRAFT_36886 [Obba rivulosa]|uniref:DUF6534 domain-containing protein n=1 Tax=Obba rivulosa TaxID=1052685 RepID=A0A8E2DJM4_9APHY|nr:hypothetical protein OBBRIDRAFT_36886 [Obba rivulosa]
MENPAVSTSNFPTVAANLDTTLGALEIGVILSAIFYGITVLQTYTYYRYNDPDWWLVKLAVFVMWLLDTVHFAFLVQILYTYTITDYGSENAILDPTTWLTVAIVATQATLDCIVRIRHLVSLALLSGGSKWILYAGISVGIGADVLTSTSQVILLWKQNAEFHRTKSIIRMLMMYSIQTGVLVTLCAISCLMLFATMPHNNLYIAVYFLLPQLLLNSLLATFNVKHNLRENATGGVVELTLSNSAHNHSVENANLARKSVRGDQFLTVRVDTISETTVDP